MDTVREILQLYKQGVISGRALNSFLQAFQPLASTSRKRSNTAPPEPPSLPCKRRHIKPNDVIELDRLV